MDCFLRDFGRESRGWASVVGEESVGGKLRAFHFQLWADWREENFVRGLVDCVMVRKRGRKLELKDVFCAKTRSAFSEYVIT